MDKNLACQWINNGTIDTLPQSRDGLIRELYILYSGNELVSRDAVKAGLLKSGIIQINNNNNNNNVNNVNNDDDNNGRINYNTSITMDQVLSAFGDSEENEIKEDSITTLIIAEKVARWIRGSCMEDLFPLEKDFNAHINSLIYPPEIISLVHQLIDGAFIEIFSDNSVHYPHLKIQDTNESPHKKQKTISYAYDYDIKTEEEEQEEDDNADEDNEGRDSENSTENNEEDRQERMEDTGEEIGNRNEEEHKRDNESGAESESGRETGNEANSEMKVGESSEHNESREDEEEETESATTEKEEQEKEKEKQKEKEKETFVDRSKESSKYTFKDLEFNEKILGALKTKGIETCNNVQVKLITAILAGKHILCQSPAGSGKTTGYLTTLLQRIDAKFHHTQLVILTTSGQSTNHVTSILGWLCPVLDLSFRNADEDRSRSHAHIVVGSIANIRESLGNVKTVVFQDAAQLFSDTSKMATFDFFRDCSHTTQVICIGQNSERPMQRILESFQIKFLHSKFSSIFFPSSSSDNEPFPLIKSHHFIHCSHRGAEITEMMRIIREEKQVVGKKIIVMATKKSHCDEAYRELDRKNLAVGYVRIGLQKQEISPMLSKFRESDMNILVVQGGVQLGDITTQVVINLAMQGLSDKYLQRTRNCGRDGASGVIYNIVPWGESEKVLGVRDKYNI